MLEAIGAEMGLYIIPGQRVFFEKMEPLDTPFFIENNGMVFHYCFLCSGYLNVNKRFYFEE